MPFIAVENRAGLQAIADTSTTQAAPIGTVIRAVDTTYGEGEFIYLKGVASTAVGNLVIYDTYANTTKLAVAGDRGPCAVAMSANVANQFGWYQISGSAVVTTTSASANGNVYVTATAGSPTTAVVAGDKADGARFKTANGTPAAGQAVVLLARPALNANG